MQAYQVHKSTCIQEIKSTCIQVHKCTCTPATNLTSWCTMRNCCFVSWPHHHIGLHRLAIQVLRPVHNKVQKYKSTKAQKYKSTKVQKHKSTKAQMHKSTKIDLYIKTCSTTFWVFF